MIDALSEELTHAKVNARDEALGVVVLQLAHDRDNQSDGFGLKPAHQEGLSQPRLLTGLATFQGFAGRRMIAWLIFLQEVTLVRSAMSTDLERLRLALGTCDGFTRWEG